MRVQRLMLVALAAIVAGVLTRAQPGRGGSQWLTAQADAQRTSWIPSDARISVETMSKPGFELQWKVRLDNPSRGTHGLTQGVTANGVTLFVPMSIVAGSSNTVYGIDNDTGYTVWRRQFDLPMPGPSIGCAGGITSAATRIVKLDGSSTSAPPGLSFGRAAMGYRSLVGNPGEGAPVEGRAGAPGRAGDPSAAAARGANPGAGPAGAARGAAPGAGAPPNAPARSSQAVERIPGAPRREETGGAFGMLFRESGVSYVVSSDGMLHVLGLPSGKDIQRPASFLPANSNWSAPIAVGTWLYTATTGNCGGTPSAVWAVDLDSETKPVVSWKTNGGSIVGAIAFAPDGTLVAAVGPGQTTGGGKANAIVTLDPKSLQLKDWFTQPNAEFVTGPTILHRNGKDLVIAATTDGRVIVMDATSLGGADHGTPLLASKPFIAAGATVSGDALAAWQQANPDAGWILLPVNGRRSAESSLANGPVSTGAVVALKFAEGTSAPALQTAWVSHDLSSPATPIIVNGVVFALATGAPATATGKGTPAVLHAYDGATGKALWNSAKIMGTNASPGSLWSAMGQVYVGLSDGTLHAFGFNDERRSTNAK